MNIRINQEAESLTEQMGISPEREQEIDSVMDEWVNKNVNPMETLQELIEFCNTVEEVAYVSIQWGFSLGANHVEDSYAQLTKN